MARKAKEIAISEEEIKELKSWVRSHTIESRYRTRAQIILMSLEGKSLDEISKSLNVTKATVNKWRNRFRKNGLNSMDDLPRAGKPPMISAETKASVIELACSRAEDGYTNWSQKRIGEHFGISQSKVGTILAEADLKPHKTDYWCGKSTDPEFTEKMTSIVGLYMEPPDNALVICVDEKTQIQALDRTQPLLPLKPGKPKRLTATYKRNGTVSLFAALSVHTGKIIGKTEEKADGDSFLKFLKGSAKKYKNKQLHIILDNHSIHKKSDVLAWLDLQKNISFHYTPTYSSWLNQIEIWFGIMTKDVLVGGVWKSKQELIDQIILYIDTYNKTRAKPFSWNYDGKPLSK
jgi:transposase